jgi:NADH-quinone oxidoreductase subunit L
MYAFLCGLLAAFLTAFYSWRLLILTFHGKPRADHHTMEHVHESPAVMLIPLLVLSVGAVLAGAVFAPLFVGDLQAAFWDGAIYTATTNEVLANTHHTPGWVPVIAKVAAFGGIALAYALYMFAPAIPGQLAARFAGLYRFLLNKWYFDELYDAIFVRPTQHLARALWKTGDARLIDGVPNGAATLAVQAARGAVRIQTGRVANYAFAMIIGLVLFVTLLLYGAR